MKVYYMVSLHNDFIIGTNKAKVLKQAKHWKEKGYILEDGLQVETFRRNLRGISDAICFGVQLAGGEPGDVKWLM